MLKLVFSYNEPNDSATHEWEYGLDHLVGPHSLAEAIDLVKKEFEESHPSAFSYKAELKFVPLEEFKYNGEWRKF